MKKVFSLWNFVIFLVISLVSILLLFNTYDINCLKKQIRIQELQQIEKKD